MVAGQGSSSRPPPTLRGIVRCVPMTEEFAMTLEQMIEKAVLKLIRPASAPAVPAKHKPARKPAAKRAAKPASPAQKPARKSRKAAKADAGVVVTVGKIEVVSYDGGCIVRPKGRRRGVAFRKGDFRLYADFVNTIRSAECAALTDAVAAHTGR